VTPAELLPSKEFFELSVCEVDEKIVRVVMMHHHNEEAYVAKGIPDALIPEIARVLDSRVGGASLEL
jgi:hypothetical protein